MLNLQMSNLQNRRFLSVAFIQAIFATEDSLTLQIVTSCRFLRAEILKICAGSEILSNTRVEILILRRHCTFCRIWRVNEESEDI